MRKDYSGRVIDNQYEIIKPITANDGNVMYLAKRTTEENFLTVKFLDANLTNNDSALKRFFREARASATISHPNICQLIDVGVSDENDPYLVSEYLEGETLESLLKREKQLSLSKSLTMIKPVLDALRVMHDKGILHRDIKPEKIFIQKKGDGSTVIKLTDFGLPKMTDGADGHQLTMAGVILGDIAYISPEQIIDASTVDKRTDIYAIGSVLYEMLTGKVPFYNVPKNERVGAKIKGSPTPPKKLNRKISESANLLLIKTLSKTPDERPRSAQEMLAGFRRILAEKEGKAPLKRNSSQATGNNKQHDISQKNNNSAHGTFKNLGNTWRNSSPIMKAAICGLPMIVLSAILIPIVAFSGSDESDTAENINNQPKQVNEIKPKPQNSQDKNETELELRGLPAGAKIYYDGAPVPVNPFRVTKKEVIVPLKVEAEGYDNYFTSIVPSENQVIRIEMKPFLQNKPTADNTATQKEEIESSAEEKEADNIQPTNSVVASKKSKPKSKSRSKKRNSSKKTKKQKKKSNTIFE